MPLTIEMTPIKSSSIKAIGYDAESATMAIQFNSGDTYHYKGVSPEAHKSLIEAESVGKHFHGKFKPNYTGVKQDSGPKKQELASPTDVFTQRTRGRFE